MNIKKKLITFMMLLTMCIGLIPTANVQASTIDFDIVSSTDVTAKQARAWAKSKGATDTFADLAYLFWKYSEVCGDVNPAIAFVQSAKETGYGKFGGVIDETYKNTCGLKTSSGGGDYDKEAHQRFNTWDEGVQAHLDHLALYAGADGYPKKNTYDPRHFVSIKGKSPTVNSLGGKWAPSPTYGEEIGKLYMNLMDYAGVDYETEDDVDDEEEVEDDFDYEGQPNPGKIETKPSGLKTETVLPTGVVDAEKITVDTITNIKSDIGWKYENKVWCYYKTDNTKAKGWIKPDNNWYFLDKTTGAMKTGWLLSGSTWYYFNGAGEMAKGWRLIGSKWYFFKDSGAMATGIINDGKSLYLLESSGAMTTKNGWVSLNNEWYYSQSSGKVKLGWLLSGSRWYYMQGDGTMVEGARKIGNKTYFLNSGGAMHTGWKQVNNTWFYFNASGEMMTGWAYLGSKYYYLYDNGAMAKGWQKLGGFWYLLNTDGAMTTGWVQSNGDYYYLDKTTGRLVTDTIVDGYKIGTNGKRGSKVSSSGSTSGSTNTGTTKKTIVVDAGHDYGKDYGAQSTINGVVYSETVLNMEVADKVKKSLESKGYKVLMTRNLGERPSFTSLVESLLSRVALANNANADLFISIHHNSATAAAVGIETLYSSNAKDSSVPGTVASNKLTVSKNLATAINNSIVSSVNGVNRGAKDQNLYVCRNTNMPSVLVEVGFITNPEEAKRCADQASQQKVADAIATAVANNFK